eukprot:COSAG01_NODE_2293_length_7967_cov_83.137646_5_plen_343_part_00
MARHTTHPAVLLVVGTLVLSAVASSGAGDTATAGAGSPAAHPPPITPQMFGEVLTRLHSLEDETARLAAELRAADERHTAAQTALQRKVGQLEVDVAAKRSRGFESGAGDTRAAADAVMRTHSATGAQTEPGGKTVPSGARFRRTQDATTLVHMHHVTLDLHSPFDVGSLGIPQSGHRRAQAALPCGILNARANAVQTECCNEPAEDCSSGYPASCNAGCATTFLPFMADCGALLGVVAAQYQPVVAMCQAAAERASRRFNLTCPTAQATNCIPACDEHLRGDLMLLNVQGDDHKFSCELQDGNHSWIAPAADGSYLGHDFQVSLSIWLAALDPPPPATLYA